MELGKKGKGSPKLTERRAWYREERDETDQNNRKNYILISLNKRNTNLQQNTRNPCFFPASFSS